MSDIVVLLCSVVADVCGSWFALVVVTGSDGVYGLLVPDADDTLGGRKDDDPPETPSVIMHMVKSLMPGQDLTRVTIPSFYLESRTLLEKLGDVMMHPHLIAKCVLQRLCSGRING